jgi:TM2 domain-containing membrane protein YozV
MRLGRGIFRGALRFWLGCLVDGVLTMVVLVLVLLVMLLLVMAYDDGRQKRTNNERTARIQLRVYGGKGVPAW